MAIREINITQIDRTSLIDIEEVQIDTSLTKEARMDDFVAKIRNPYCFLCGDVPVQIRFVSQKKTLADTLVGYFTSLK